MFVQRHLVHLTQEIVESSEDEMLQTLPLTSRQRSKYKVGCRTILKEIIGTMYLIKDEYSLRKLAEDMDELNAKAKEIMPKKDGVPMGEEPNGFASGRELAVVESPNEIRPMDTD